MTIDVGWSSISKQFYTNILVERDKQAAANPVDNANISSKHKLAHIATHVIVIGFFSADTP